MSSSPVNISPVTLAGFIRARIMDDQFLALAVLGSTTLLDDTSKEWLKDVVGEDKHVPETQYRFVETWSPRRALQECRAKLLILEQYENWPVFVEQEEPDLMDINIDNFTYEIERKMKWLNTRSFIKEFGVAPPAMPMVKAMAAVYSDHPDYNEEWKL